MIREVRELLLKSGFSRELFSSAPQAANGLRGEVIGTSDKLRMLMLEDKDGITYFLSFDSEKDFSAPAEDKVKNLERLYFLEDLTLEIVDDKFHLVN